MQAKSTCQFKDYPLPQPLTLPSLYHTFTVCQVTHIEVQVVLQITEQSPHHGRQVNDVCRFDLGKQLLRVLPYSTKSKVMVINPRSLPLKSIQLYNHQLKVKTKAFIRKKLICLKKTVYMMLKSFLNTSLVQICYLILNKK